MVNEVPPGPVLDVPSFTELSPVRAPAGSDSFTMTAYGSGFVNGRSLVLWGTQRLVTTVTSDSTLRAVVPSTVLAVERQVEVTVINSPPGGGMSNVARFTVESRLPNRCAEDSGSISKKCAGWNGGFAVNNQWESFRPGS